jgi:hypothetical protein
MFFFPQTRTRWRSLSLLTLGLSITVLVGCGGKKPTNQASVKGTVTYKNAPVTGGMIMVIPAGTSGTGTPVAIKPDGSFQGIGLPVGNVLVTVDTSNLKNKPSLPQPPPGMKPPPGVNQADINVNMPDFGTYVEIPAKYAKKETSGITWDLQPGTQEKPITLAD